MARGTFIVIYGINNIGKTTHAKRLTKRLLAMGKPAVYVKYPVYALAPSGHFLNKILRSGKKQEIPEEELQLWYVLNRYQFQPTLEKWLDEGKIVIAEDYVGTGLAWGAAKGANMRELEFMNQFLVREDVGILMVGQRKDSAKEEKHLHEQQGNLLEKCAAVFLKLQKKYGWKTVKVDADPDVTAKRLWTLVSKEIM